jgi:hypothetical protein
LSSLPCFFLSPELLLPESWGHFPDMSLHGVHNVWRGFATIPAFLADIFGSENVGAIHGAVLTAWSAAAITGHSIITEFVESRQSRAACGRKPCAYLRHAAASPSRPCSRLDLF